MTPEIWSHLLRLGKIAGVVGAITAAIIGVATAWPLIEPYVAAHRGYVRHVAAEIGDKNELAQHQNRKVIRDLQIEQADGKRDQIEEAIFKWEIELAKITDEQARFLINSRIRELQNTKSKLENQIETLNKAKSNN